MLKQRILTASALFAALLMVLFWGGPTGWLVMLTLSAFLAAREWFGLAFSEQTQNGGIAYASAVAAMVAALPWLATIPLGFWLALTVVLTFWMVGSVWWYQKQQGQVSLDSVLGKTYQAWWSLLIGAMLIVLFHVTTWLLLHGFGPVILLLSLFVIWAVDTGAYFSGRQFGRTKLAVYVSPGKTWEGVLGGGLFAFVVAWIGLAWLDQMFVPGLNASLPFLALGLTAIGLLSVFGDLFESLLKRLHHRKDSGRLLPGHGGLLDRIDSLLLAVPWLFFFWLTVS
ncbi:MAG: phosphatidate cytidylyltransferase [Hydrogenovibrio sp.]|uniref:phosphatidate cytidylyltransferase n=1 Tax=Hydrogenovibrio sp. TaxID=2065821 RepID=UPI0028701D98|nr:phosphatidate cytidylyltransferase [Hydrogenovibrio sp.]MDR9497628.1 phosphatidate cytidylyltransferase [Hydrogenovibrio sp.]